MNKGNCNSINVRPLPKSAKRRERKKKLLEKRKEMQELLTVSDAIFLGNLPGFFGNVEIENLLQHYTGLDKSNSLFYIEILKREREPGELVVDAVIKFVIKAHTLLALEKLQVCKSLGYNVVYKEEKSWKPSPFECEFNSRFNNYLEPIRVGQIFEIIAKTLNTHVGEVLQSSNNDSDTVALKIGKALEETSKSSIDEATISENSADSAVDAANKTENVFEKNSEESNDSTSTLIIKQEQVDFNESITLISHELSNNDQTVKIKQEPMNTVDLVPHKLNEVDHSEPQFSEMEVNDNALNEILDNFDPSEIEFKQEPMETNESGQAEVELPVEKSINKNEEDLKSLVSNDKRNVSDNAVNEILDNFDPSEKELKQEPMETHDSNQAEIEKIPLEKSINKNEEDLTSIVSNDKSHVSDNTVNEILDNFDPSEKELKQEPMETHDSNQAEIELPIEKSINKNDEDLTNSVSKGISLVSDNAINKISDNFDPSEIELEQKHMETHDFNQADVELPIEKITNKNEEDLTSSVSIDMSLTSSDENNIDAMTAKPTNKALETYYFKKAGRKNPRTIIKNKVIPQITDSGSATVPQETSANNTSIEKNSTGSLLSQLSSDIDKAPASDTSLSSMDTINEITRSTDIDKIAVNINNDVAKELNDTAKDTEIGENDKNYADYKVQIKNLPILNRSRTIHLLKDELLPRVVKKTAIDCVQIYVLQDEIERRPLGEALVKFGVSPYLYAQQTCKLDGVEVLNNKIQVKLVRGQNILKDHIKSQLTRKRKRQDSSESSENDESPVAMPSEHKGDITDMDLFKRKYSSPGVRNLEDYGFKPEFLQELGLKPPLSNAIIVKELHPMVDEGKLHEVFSLAGEIKNLKFSEEERKARIEYDHPVEAVQAIHIFRKQSLFDEELKIHMDVAFHLRPLPIGLSGINKGLARNGEPLKAVRTIMELKNIHETLYELGKMIKYESIDNSDPFSTWYGKRAFATSTNINNISNNSSKVSLPSEDIQPAKTSVSNQNNGQPSDSDSNVIEALGTILMARGFIPTGTDCKDLKNIVSALQTNHVNHCDTSSTNHQNMNIMNITSELIPPNVTSSITISNLTAATGTHNPSMNVPSQSENINIMPPKVSSPNMVPNLTNITTGTNNPTTNVPSQLSNMPRNITSQNVIPNVTNTATVNNHLTKNVPSQSIDTKKSNDTSPNVISNVTNTANGPNNTATGKNNLTKNVPSQSIDTKMKTSRTNDTSPNVVPNLTKTATSTNNPTMNLPPQLSNMCMPPNGTSSNVMPNLNDTTGSNNPTMNVPSQLSNMPSNATSQRVIPNVTTTATGKNNLTKNVPSQSIDTKMKKSRTNYTSPTVIPNVTNTATGKNILTKNVPSQSINTKKKKNSRKIFFNKPPQRRNMYMPPNGMSANLIQNVTNIPQTPGLIISYGHIPVPQPFVQTTIWEQSHLNQWSDDRQRKFPRDPRANKVSDTGSDFSDQNEGTKKLIFQNLPPSVTQAELTKKLSEVGDVSYCVVARGSAVVAFNSLKDAARCYQDYFIGRRWMAK